MTTLNRTISLEHSAAQGDGRTRRGLENEWIITNGLGGYASGTLAGINTRRFHGWLIAALPAPYGRTMMLNQLEEVLCVGNKRHTLVAEDLALATQQDLVSDTLVEFRLEDGLPVWVYRCAEFELEKRACMVHRQNTTFLCYKLLRGAAAELELRPSLDMRPHEGSVAGPKVAGYTVKATSRGYEIGDDNGELPPLLLSLTGPDSSFRLSTGEVHDLQYREEQRRGYDWVGSLWSPGSFSATLTEGQSISLRVSTESWERADALSVDDAFAMELERRRRLLQRAPEGARTGMAGELVLAADQFIIVPVGRVNDTVRAHAVGDEIRTVIAGYHWFTDWGRDTMISLEGLTISTGRVREGEFILRSFAQYIRRGLIPNMFPEGNVQGLYHTADATLWFFHGIERYMQASHDHETLRYLLPKMIEVAEWHLRGTDFGICVDPEDGLLRQGAEGVQLTWMDAKVDGWVVTPRRGKAVEINALWYNALMLLSGWLQQLGRDAEADKYRAHAERARKSFAEKFWYAEGNYCYDIVEAEPGATVTDGLDRACRPNQVFAISLEHPILDRQHWPAVLSKVREELFTPVGMRSLAPGSPDYKSRYYGDLRTRDAAYHQGTVWGWLIGPFVDAWLKTYPEDSATAASFLDGFEHHLSEAGIGTISEVFDAESPFTPRACIAQAWSVAEVLRLKLKLAELNPDRERLG